MEKAAGYQACRFSSFTQITHSLQTVSTQPWYPVLIPSRKEQGNMELNIQSVSMTYPNGKQALRDLDL